MSEPSLFVYGTLRNGSNIEQQRLLRSHAKLVGAARIQAIMYDLGGYPGIQLSDNSSDIVNGELYRLRPQHQDELLARLDEYEECSPQFPQPHEYRRSLARVMLEHKQACIRAWVYLYNRTPVAGGRIASGDYYKR